MKKLFEAWCGISLVKRIVAGLIIGAILGIALPQFTVFALVRHSAMSAAHHRQHQTPV